MKEIEHSPRGRHAALAKWGYATVNGNVFRELLIEGRRNTIVLSSVEIRTIGTQQLRL